MTDTESRMPTPDDYFDERAFFAARVREIQERGILKTYDKPRTALDAISDPEKHRLIAEEIAQRTFDTKTNCFDKGHLDPRKNQPGTVWHIGDEPFSNFTNFVPNQYSQEEMALKSHSVGRAIHEYMPTDRFREYVGHFVKNADDAVYYGTKHVPLEHSFNMAWSQLANPNHQSLGFRSLEDSIENHPKNVSRALIPKSKAIDKLADHPELLLAMVLYHAAHASYLSELNNAFEDAYEHGEGWLSFDEYDNGHYTLHTNSFKQYNSFLLFESVLSLTLHYYYGEDEPLAAPATLTNDPVSTLSGVAHEGRLTDHPVKIDRERMHRAIKTAWGAMFDKGIFQRDFDPGGQYVRDPSQPVDKVMVCPARGPLKRGSSAQIIESIYDDIISHPEMYASLLKKARDTAKEIILDRQQDIAL